MRAVRSLTVAGVGGAFLGAWVMGWAAGQYTVTDLGALDGTSSSGRGINNLGHVTGVYQASDGYTHAFWYSEGTAYDLGTGGTYSFGYGINDADQIVGAGDGVIALFQKGGWTILQGLYPMFSFLSHGYAINAQGALTGDSNTEAGQIHAFLYTASGMADLGTLGGPFSYGYGINNLNHVTGVATFPRDPVTRKYPSHAFLHDGSSMIDLGTLGGGSSVGWGINDAGQIAGAAQVENDEWHAAIYTGGQWIDLGTHGGTNATLRAINPSGVAVGFYEREGARRALRFADGALMDLNELIPTNSGWVITDAYAINSQGQITGEGLIGGVTHAFIATPANAQPSLSIVQADPDTFALSWSAEFGPPWQPQAASALPATGWTPVAGSPVLDHGRYTLALTPGPTTTLYRLARP